MKEQRQMMQDRKIKNVINSNKAITLIALVITIIVLLILAGITIATLTGENRNTEPIRTSLGTK